MSQRLSFSITRGVCAAVCLMAAAAAPAQTVTKIAVGPSPALVGRTVPVQMHAWATFSSGAVADVSAQVTWSSASGQSVVSATGLLTSVANGSDAIQAALGSATASAPAFSVTNSDNQTVTATIPVGNSPVAAAVNPLTNKIYIANSGSNNVTVIDGLTNATTAIATGASPSGVAVNPVTNRIYVSNQGGNSVTVIDGAAGATATVSTLTAPSGVAVNPVSNQVFVICKNGVTIINGSNNQTISIPLASFATSVAVNPATNTAYVPTFSTGIAVIDGNTQSVTATIPLSSSNTLSMIVVDPAINRLYGCGLTSNGCLVIDGNTGLFIAPTGSSLKGQTIAVNPVTSQALAVSNAVTVYNPNTNSASLVQSTGELSNWNAAAVNPVTGDAYVLSTAANTIGVLDGAQGYTLTSTIAGLSPIALTINPATNKVYVVDQGSNSVTVIDGASNQSTNLGTTTGPFDVQVDPYTNKAYFVNTPSNNVSVVDGATNSITTVAVGASPAAAAVNPLTGKIYIANQSSNNVTVIDGATNGTSTITTGKGPFAVALNPLTDQIYVANTDGTVTIIAGGTGGTTSLNDGVTGGDFSLSPFGMALNTVTNKLYIPNFNGGTVTILDGTAGAVSSVPAGMHPIAIAVNSFTNQIYVANLGSQNVTVIDGPTSQTTSLPLTFNPSTIGVNKLTGRVYVGGIDFAVNLESLAVIDPTVTPATVSTVLGPAVAPLTALVVDEVTNRVYAAGSGAPIIGLDGETNAITMQSDPLVGLPVQAAALALNPLTHQVYGASSQNGPPQSVLAEEPVVTSPLRVSVTSLPGNTTINPTPTFALTAVDGLDSGLAATRNVNVYFRFDARDGAWSTATPNGNGTFAVTPAAPLEPGLHILLAFATNGREGTMAATGLNLGNGDGPVIGQIAEYLFFVQTANTPTILSFTIGAPLTSLFTGATEQLIATVQFSKGAVMDVTNSARWQSSNPAAATIGGAGLLTPAGTGSTTITATFEGFTATQSITTATTMSQLQALPSLTTDGSGNYVVQLSITNTGNITLSNIELTSAQLGSTTGPLPGSIPSLAPGATQVISVTFPASAGAPKTGALLRIAAAYSLSIPDGPTQQSSLSANFRVSLP